MRGRHSLCVSRALLIRSSHHIWAGWVGGLGFSACTQRPSSPSHSLLSTATLRACSAAHPLTWPGAAVLLRGSVAGSPPCCASEIASSLYSAPPPHIPPPSTPVRATTVPAPFSLEDYLVAACGLTPTQAREVSKKAFHQLSKPSSKEISHSHLNSASNPDAILALLSGAGLSRADIATVVSADPLLLRASVKNIAPRLLALRDRVGLSTPQITRFLLVSSRALRGGDVVPKIEYFISFYGSFEQVLVVLKRNGSLLTASLESLIKPNIALLCQWGVRDIVRLCSNNAWLLNFNPERVKEFLPRSEQLGVPPTSRMFRHAVAVVASNPKEKVAAKLEFFKRAFGCSEPEVSSVVSKMPAILEFSDEILLCKIEFLVNEVAMEPHYILQRPVVLALSLEKRLVLRYYVMKVLREKGLLDSRPGFCTFAKLGEDAFRLRFIDCHKDSVPSLADAYATTRVGIVPSRVWF